MAFVFAIDSRFGWQKEAEQPSNDSKCSCVKATRSHFTNPLCAWGASDWFPDVTECQITSLPRRVKPLLYHVSEIKCILREAENVVWKWLFTPQTDHFPNSVESFKTRGVMCADWRELMSKASGKTLCSNYFFILCMAWCHWNMHWRGGYRCGEGDNFTHNLQWLTRWWQPTRSS